MNKKIAICSSMQFKKEITQTAYELGTSGWIVLTPELSEKSTNYLLSTEKEQRKAKAKFIKDHFERIRKSDAILVLNYEKKGVSGYIGSNTLMEIGVAFSLGKKVYVLYDPGEQSCKEEVLSLASNVLNGNLELLRN
ncbi:MAG TPA: hypothetical protein VF465_08480 [Flavobacterium sp.]|uniref:hypothetical protein n=1 Tax=Flavobacterium sp. TaxID=239 RepID=UPI002ED260FD